jgi:hypothetical protein
MKKKRFVMELTEDEVKVKNVFKAKCNLRGLSAKEVLMDCMRKFNDRNSFHVDKKEDK